MGNQDSTKRGVELWEGKARKEESEEKVGNQGVKMIPAWETEFLVLKVQKTVISLFRVNGGKYE